MEKEKLGSGMLFKPVNQAGLRASPTPWPFHFPQTVNSSNHLGLGFLPGVLQRIQTGTWGEKRGAPRWLAAGARHHPPGVIEVILLRLYGVACWHPKVHRSR